MPGFTPFTSNYSDLSDENGYQFEFRCDVCGSGYRSEFIRSQVGTAGTILQGASGLIGGLWGASRVASTARDVVDRGARDEALKKASNEIMQLFQRCPRCSKWVDETCWNDQRNLCVGCAPKLATEMEAERQAVEIEPDARRDAHEDHLLGRHERSPDGLPELRTAGRLGEVLRELRLASGNAALHAVRGGAGDRGAVLRELRREDCQLRP